IFNTAASFVTNTNLQHYSGEVSMSYLSQLFALMWLQFVSAATGIAALTALSRGLSGKQKLGNFYRDLLNAALLVLLPIAIVDATLLVLGGVPMTFHGAASAETLEGVTQTIARGPVAAFVAIKQLGTNGGGWFGPNSTHPFENPTFFTNIVESIDIVLLAMSSVWMFGRITKRMRHAAVIFAAMAFMLVCLVGAAVYFESAPTQAFTGLPVEHSMNLEGKELRFGSSAGPLWATITTNTSNGSVDAMHDSLNPLTGLVPLTGMWLNTIFGGVGVGFVNMFIYIIVAVFICGMMVGRTPEYLTKKVETREMKLALLALLVHPFLILFGTAIFSMTPWGTATVLNPGAHGFSEILYEFSSAAANNGSGFEGLGDATVPWNVATGLVMLLARYIPIILPLAIAGSLAVKKPAPVTAGTLGTDTLLFGFVILGTIVLIGALLFMPVAVLGPINEYVTSAAMYK
ncbi:MAG: potassium-transporting ATPase subunit A, partial [Candidatus Dadabacteria bacterium]